MQREYTDAFVSRKQGEKSLLVGGKNMHLLSVEVGTLKSPLSAGEGLDELSRKHFSLFIMLEILGLHCALQCKDSAV